MTDTMYFTSEWEMPRHYVYDRKTLHCLPATAESLWCMADRIHLSANQKPVRVETVRRCVRHRDYMISVDLTRGQQAHKPWAKQSRQIGWIAALWPVCHIRSFSSRGMSSLRLVVLISMGGASPCALYVSRVSDEVTKKVPMIWMEFAFQEDTVNRPFRLCRISLVTHFLLDLQYVAVRPREQPFTPAFHTIITHWIIYAKPAASNEFFFPPILLNFQISNRVLRLQNRLETIYKKYIYTYIFIYKKFKWMNLWDINKDTSHWNNFF